MEAMKDFMDRILNWSGGTYVGLSTLVMLGLAVAQAWNNKWTAPEWFVGGVGLYTVILALFVARQPIASLADRLGKKAEGQGPGG